jgi:hypothetical protein
LRSWPSSSGNRLLVIATLTPAFVIVTATISHAAPLPGFQHGVCYAHAWRDGGRNGYGSATSRASLVRLKALGVDAISLTPFGFQRSRASDSVHLVYDHGGESDAALAAETRQAHALGLHVMLKPHIWITDGEWIGEQDLDSDAAWARWFASYRAFILHYARLAEAEHMELLAVGTELARASVRDRPRWAALIAEVRAIYHGAITYAANWNEAERVVFWDLVDAVGVQEYEPPATHASATLDELRAGWRAIAVKLGALARTTGRPILVTELGYRPTPEAALAPSAWPERDGNPRYDGEHQARCYRAALEVLTRASWCRGIYIWKWFTDSTDESGPTDFSPAGKPAESVLGELYRATTN